MLRARGPVCGRLGRLAGLGQLLQRRLDSGQPLLRFVLALLEVVRVRVVRVARDALPDA